MKSKKLKIYYGNPSKNYNSNQLIKIINNLTNYDIIILKSGLEHKNNLNHKQNFSVLQSLSLSHKLIFGHLINSNNPNDIKNNIFEWKKIGVKGIFIDKSNHENENSVIQECYQNNLIILINDKIFNHFILLNDLYWLDLHFLINDDAVIICQKETQLNKQEYISSFSKIAKIFKNLFYVNRLMTTNIKIPKKLAIFYGWPSLVNSSNGNVVTASEFFNKYDSIVFGTGLEENSHPDHEKLRSIISLLPNKLIFGYIDSTLNLDIIQNRIDNWYSMGVKGIFLDKFGYDFGLTRIKQREIVWCIHEKGTGLKAFVNAWKPDDVFGQDVSSDFNPEGLSTRLGANDIYLAESFGIIYGSYDDNDFDLNGIKDFQDKAEKMLNYKQTFGTELASVTTWNESEFDQSKLNYSYALSVINEFDYFGFGELFFSASSSQLPFRSRPDIPGTKFTGTLTKSNGRLSRSINAGIDIDTINHQIDNILE